ncbi:MAG: hypothetical protein Q7S22_03205 [Candidatus Micrarchaeota archaeon]|nr:hypothetical protein [Candidatus Micrarchaeota archaeon]
MATRAFRNRDLQLRDYTHLCGTARERQVVSALPIVDRFVEIKSLRGRRDFNPTHYRELYGNSFPNPDERSPWSAMIGSVGDMNHIDHSAKLQAKYRHLRYHDVVALKGRAVAGFTSFATMPLESGKSVVYDLYTGVADRLFMLGTYGIDTEFRSRGIAHYFYVLRHGMAEEDGRKLGYSSEVAGTMLESEMIGQANDEQSIRNTRTRLQIHQRMGALVLMIDAGSDCWITPHLQPKLSDDSNPLLMHLLFRRLQADGVHLNHICEIDRELATSFLRAYIYSFEHQSTTTEIDEMRSNTDSRLAAGKRFILVPPDKLPDMVTLASNDPLLREQIERDYGSFDGHARKVKQVLGQL